MSGYKFSQILLIELIAIFLGIAFGIIPALMGLITNPNFHALLIEDVRMLFVPFIFAAIICAAVTGRGPIFFFLGMGATCCALALIGATAISLKDSFVLLFIAQILLGGGVGSLLTILSRWVFTLFPKRSFSAMLFLWAGVSFGMLLSGLLIDFTLILHKWWLAPLLVLGALFVLLLLLELLVDLPHVPKRKEALKGSIFLFLIPAVLYGYLMSNLGVWHYDLMLMRFDLLFFSFWTVITVARFLIGLFFPLLSPIIWYCAFAVVIVIAPLILPLSTFFLAFALAALFPINLAWTQKRFGGGAGLVIACYLLGIALGQPYKLDPLVIVSGGALLFFFHLFTGIAFPAKKKEHTDHNKTGS